MSFMNTSASCSRKQKESTQREEDVWKRAIAISGNQILFLGKNNRLLHFFEQKRFNLENAYYEKVLKFTFFL